MPCRGHDEKQESLNRGNFIELLKFHAEGRTDVEDVVLDNAPKNCQSTSPSIQKDIINACAKETTKAIIAEIGDQCFAILAAESADISDKEELLVCLRYVSKSGGVMERFLGIVHVPNTTSLTIKNAIESMLMEHSLTLSKVRGQAYDGASNMRGSISFMTEYDCDIPNMEDLYVIHMSSGRRMVRGKAPQVTNLHHYRVEVFLSVIDLKLQELDIDSAREPMSCLFVCLILILVMDSHLLIQKKLFQLAKFYPNEFPNEDFIFSEESLKSFIGDVRYDARFSDVKTLNDLSIKLVETGKHETHVDVYLLLKLVLLLPVATATVERTFSGMNHIKSKVRNSMGD